MKCVGVLCFLMGSLDVSCRNLLPIHHTLQRFHHPRWVKQLLSWTSYTWGGVLGLYGWRLLCYRRVCLVDGLRRKFCFSWLVVRLPWICNQWWTAAVIYLFYFYFLLLLHAPKLKFHVSIYVLWWMFHSPSVLKFRLLIQWGNRLSTGWPGLGQSRPVSLSLVLSGFSSWVMED